MNNWKKIPIGDVVESTKKWNPSRSTLDEVFNYIDLSAIDQDSKLIVGMREVSCKEAPSRARQLVAKDDILVSTVRPNLNGVGQVPDYLDGATASTGFCILRPRSSLLDGRFLFHWVKSPVFIADMVNKATGASYPAVSDRIILESFLPFPPLPEQKRIADILDCADSLRVKRRVALYKLDELVQSVFIEMFGDPVANINGWKIVPLSEYTTKIGSGATPRGGKSAYKTSGISLIRSLNVRDGEFNHKDLAFIDEQQATKLSNVQVEKNDVLLNITGASVARVCRVPDLVLPARVNQHVSIIRPNSDLNSVFLEQLLLSSSMKKKLLRISGAGATREAITKAQLEEFEVILPPLSLQQEFAQIIATIEKQRSLHKASLAELDELFASLQYRAFRGEL